MRNWVAIGLAGMAGVLARHAIRKVIPPMTDFPIGTFLVNVTGALLIGLLAGLVVHRLQVPMWIQEALTVGFLGGFTTFSAVALETAVLMERGRMMTAAVYSAGTMVAGLIAVFVGLRLGRLGG